jgi:hypothetical protein
LVLSLTACIKSPTDFKQIGSFEADWSHHLCIVVKGEPAISKVDLLYFTYRLKVPSEVSVGSVIADGTFYNFGKTL